MFLEVGGGLGSLVFWELSRMVSVFVLGERG